MFSLTLVISWLNSVKFPVSGITLVEFEISLAETQEIDNIINIKK
jgi:hypothetical protein